MFAVVVTFQITPANEEAFLTLMLANAATSRTQEPGCLRFDVCTDPARPGEVFLYEIYTNAAAFDAHLASAHFIAFDAEAAPMIAAKSVRTYVQVVS